MKAYVIIALTLLLGLAISLEAGLYIVYQTVKEQRPSVEVCHQWDRSNYVLTVKGNTKTYYDTVAKIGVQQRSMMCK